MTLPNIPKTDFLSTNDASYRKDRDKYDNTGGTVRAKNFPWKVLPLAYFLTLSVRYPKQSFRKNN